MKISLLKERENFDEILIKSLSQFLENKYKWTGELGFSFIPNTKKFIVNDLLNIFYPASISRNKLAPLTQEFSWNPNPIKTLLQKIYIFVSVRFPLEKYLSSSAFYISDNQGVLDGVVIIPGNHSIRLVNINTNICTVICKSGFNNSLLIKDAQVRLDNNALNVPNVIQLNTQEGWYQEERVIGLPLNRLGSEVVKETFLIKCQNDLKLFYQNSLIKVDTSTLLKSLERDINNLTTQIVPSLEHEVRSSLLFIMEYLLRKISLCEENDFNICDTHGDFQPANILCAEDEFWIIDWEYSKQRSIFYDALVFDLESRFTSQLSTRLINFFERIKSGDEFFSWTGVTLNKNNIYYIYVFLLEDIELKLQELSNEAIQNKNEKLKPFLTEIQLFLSSLNK